MDARALAICALVVSMSVGSVACAEDVARNPGNASSRTAASQASPDAAAIERSTRPASVADGVAQSALPRRGQHRLVGLDRLGLGAGGLGLDPGLRDFRQHRPDAWRTTSGGAAPLPADLQALPRPPGTPASDRPSPVISLGEQGGTIGLSYKIKPP
jgi:hypothetical protein